MVLIAQSSSSSDVRIMARGNFSLDAGGLIVLLLALTLVTLGLAGALAWQGFWPVLLIAVIQVLLVTWILVRAWERAWVFECIDIGPERISVLQQRHRRKRQYELDAAWAVVELERPEVAWYGPRVILRSRGTAVELGKFLTLDEKSQLAEYVRRAIQKHSALKGAFNA
jgi:uncharacterized membrane protein